MLVVACNPLGLALRACLVNMNTRILAVEMPAIDSRKDILIWELKYIHIHAQIKLFLLISDYYFQTFLFRLYITSDSQTFKH